MAIEIGLVAAVLELGSFKWEGYYLRGSASASVSALIIDFPSRDQGSEPIRQCASRAAAEDGLEG